MTRSTSTLIGFLLLTVILVRHGHSLQRTPTTRGRCPDSWIPYGDQKCYKLLEEYLTWEEALEKCQNIPTGTIGTPNLAIIKSDSEQLTVNELLFYRMHTPNNSWIGASRTGSDNNKFQFNWIDGEPVKFTNWLEGCPSSDDGNYCVQLESGDDSVTPNESLGKWKDVSCLNKNWALCECWPSWSFDDMQIALYDLRKRVENVEAASESTGQEVNHLKDNLVPIGFMYMQLPYQVPPQTLWPNFGWTEVTSKYAGLFFRAKGGNSADFGSIQDDQTRSVTKFQFEECYSDYCPAYPSPVDLKENGWSPYGWAGYNYFNGAAYYEALRFYTSGGEVRPCNTAILIWERTN